MQCDVARTASGVFGFITMQEVWFRGSEYSGPKVRNTFSVPAGSGLIFCFLLFLGSGFGFCVFGSVIGFVFGFVLFYVVLIHPRVASRRLPVMGTLPTTPSHSVFPSDIVWMRLSVEKSVPSFWLLGSAVKLSWHSAPALEKFMQHAVSSKITFAFCA